MQLETPRLELMLPGDEAIPRIIAFYGKNAEHLLPWEPAPAPGFLTTAHWEERLARFRREQDDNVSVRLFLFGRGAGDSAPILGIVSFTRFFALPVKSAQLGYAVDREHEGQGLMSEAVQHAVAHVARARSLRRVTATYQVDNVRSARVLARAGFTVDRVIPRHLFTAGAWHDHTLVHRDFDAPRADST